MLLQMGRSPERHFKSTAGRIPTQLKSVLVVEDAESSITGHLSLVQMSATGLIHQTAGMVIVEKTHQPPMQPIYN
jgi:hypothetical protein